MVVMTIFLNFISSGAKIIKNDHNQNSNKESSIKSIPIITNTSNINKMNINENIDRRRLSTLLDTDGMKVLCQLSGFCRYVGKSTNSPSGYAIGNNPDPTGNDNTICDYVQDPPTPPAENSYYKFQQLVCPDAADHEVYNTLKFVNENPNMNCFEAYLVDRGWHDAFRICAIAYDDITNIISNPGTNFFYSSLSTTPTNQQQYVKDELFDDFGLTESTSSTDLFEYLVESRFNDNIYNKGLKVSNNKFDFVIDGDTSRPPASLNTEAKPHFNEKWELPSNLGDLVNLRTFRIHEDMYKCFPLTSTCHQGPSGIIPTSIGK